MSYTIRKFQPETDVIKPFDCGQADLNGFLLETNSDAPNATLYDKEFLAVTYVAVDGAEPFYTKCGFTRLSDPQEDDETVLLFFDLKSWSQTRGT